MARQPAEYDVHVVRVSPQHNAQLVRTGPTTAVPDGLSATVTVDEGRLSVTVMVAVTAGGQAKVIELSVHGGPASPGPTLPAVTTSSLRRILVDQVLRAVLAGATVDVEPDEDEAAVDDSVRGKAPIAARHYQAALASGSRAPTEAVAAALGVSRPQASRYVRAAREAGLLPPA